MLTKRAILKLAAFFRRTHNLSWDEFRRLTPRELHELEKTRLEEKQYDEDAAEIRVARICHLLVAINTPKNSRKPKIEDFLPDRLKHLITDNRAQTPDEMASAMRRIGGGRVFKKL